MAAFEILHRKIMKSNIRHLVTAAVSLVTVITSTPASRAADLTLDGSGYYNLDSSEYRSNGRYLQSGRYNSLGKTYYHSAEIGMDEINNNSSVGSGSLSFELWAMPYYGANRGPILMTYGLSPLRGGYYLSDVVAEGEAVSLDRYAFPELDLFEYTRKGWKWRDVLMFSYDDLL